MLDIALYVLIHKNYIQRDPYNKGDILRFDRWCYSHYGVYIGGGKVIHRTGNYDGAIARMLPFSSQSAPSDAKGTLFGIQIQTLRDAKGITGKAPVVDNYLDSQFPPFPPEVIVSQAKDMVGTEGYNLIYENCEHLATWCRNGVARSKQVDFIKPVADYINKGNQTLIRARNELGSLLNSAQKVQPETAGKIGASRRLG